MVWKSFYVPNFRDSIFLIFFAANKHVDMEYTNNEMNIIFKMMKYQVWLSNN